MDLGVGANEETTPGARSPATERRKPARDAKRKEFAEQVRAAADFAQKRDPRVARYQERLRAEREARAEAREAERRRRRDEFEKERERWREEVEYERAAALECSRRDQRQLEQAEARLNAAEGVVSQLRRDNEALREELADALQKLDLGGELEQLRMEREQRALNHRATNTEE